MVHRKSKGVHVMLVLSRKVNEEIVIGNDICITVVRVEGNRIRLGISAPDDLNIRRGEIAFESPAIEARAGNRSPAELVSC
jgi:carbon storage regulator